MVNKPTRGLNQTDCRGASRECRGWRVGVVVAIGREEGPRIEVKCGVGCCQRRIKTLINTIKGNDIRDPVDGVYDAVDVELASDGRRL